MVGLRVVGFVSRAVRRTLLTLQLTLVTPVESVLVVPVGVGEVIFGLPLGPEWILRFHRLISMPLLLPKLTLEPALYLTLLSAPVCVSL